MADKHHSAMPVYHDSLFATDVRQQARQRGWGRKRKAHPTLSGAVETSESSGEASGVYIKVQQNKCRCPANIPTIIKGKT